MPTAIKKISADMTGIILKSNPDGRHVVICIGLPEKVIMSANGEAEIDEVIYKRYPLSIVSDVYTDLNYLLQLRCSGHEGFKNFQQRFRVFVAKFNTNGASNALLETIAAIMLLSNYEVH